MSGAYCYCTKCGEELSDSLKERYEREHNGGPVLCMECVLETLQELPSIAQAIMDAYGAALRNVFNPGKSDD